MPAGDDVTRGSAIWNPTDLLLTAANSFAWGFCFNSRREGTLPERTSAVLSVTYLKPSKEHGRVFITSGFSISELNDFPA